MKQKALFVFAHTTPRPLCGDTAQGHTGLIGMLQKNFFQTPKKFYRLTEVLLAGASSPANRLWATGRCLCRT